MNIFSNAIKLFLLLIATPVLATSPSDNYRLERPNIVIVFIDDMGYADIGPFGAEDYATPNLDRMAREGRIFTDFHASTAVCSASRASLLTGCYSERVSIRGALFPDDTTGISDEETTLAEICKSRGYATACFGKWHLGHHPKFLPLQHGFDEYFGLPYSNDMWPLNPSHLNQPMEKRFPPLPLIAGEKVIKNNVTGEDQSQLTTWYTEYAVNFIQHHKDQPFFLYIPHSMVHVPLFVSDKFKGKSKCGLFGDVVMEVDWSVGQILQALKDSGVDNNTLVIFTSDNGPWLRFGNHAGSAKPLREGKGTIWEGGYREPAVMRWPSHIPANTTCNELASTIDILPTVAKLIGADLPNHKIDGHDISPLIIGQPKARSPWKTMFCYYNGELRAVRDERWKLVFPHTFITLGGRPGGTDGMPVSYQRKTTSLALYDLKTDIGETTDVKDRHPEIVQRLTKAAEEARDDLGDTLTKRKGKNIRRHGILGPEDERLTW